MIYGLQKTKISTKDVMSYIKKEKTVTYLQLVSKFCPNENDRELRTFVAHNVRQKIYLQINRGTSAKNLQRKIPLQSQLF